MASNVIIKRRFLRSLRFATPGPLAPFFTRWRWNVALKRIAVSPWGAERKAAEGV